MKPRILIIDDEQSIVDTVSQYLAECGNDATGLSDATLALEAVRANTYDLVLTDLRMPNVSGMDIVQALADKGGDTVVIVLTGYATVDTAIESLNFDVFAYLNKPFNLQELAQVVDKALTQQRLKRENDALTRKVQSMLHNITTLHEMTRIIYDAEDWNLSKEMVLDTLGFGLGMSHTCILVRDADGEYDLGQAAFPKGSNMNERVAAFNWDSMEETVSKEEPTMLTWDRLDHPLIKQLADDDEALYGLYFTPIRFRNDLVGYLVAFLANADQDIPEDQRTLLQILATLIAPQVGYSQRWEVETELAYTREPSSPLMSLTREFDALKAIGGNLGLALLRFVTARPLNAAEATEVFHRQCKDLIAEHDSDAQAYWLTADTAMTVLPGANRVQAEVICMAMRDDFRRSESVRLDSAGQAELIYSCASWPQDGDSADQLLATVQGRLVGETHRYTYNHLNAKPAHA